MTSGTYTFNTDTGDLSPQIGDSPTPPGWNDAEKRFVLSTFTVESGASLEITGSLPFKLTADEQISVSGTLDFSGQNGANGADGALGGNGGTGGVHGGDGGQGGGLSISGPNSAAVAAGAGGNGGDSDRDGGTGGNGGGAYVGDGSTGSATAGAGGNGGSLNGSGGAGGSSSP